MCVWPFEGRERNLLHATFTASDVDLVLVMGPAGVGKTRLAREVISTLGAPRTAWVSATRSAATLPFGAVLALLPHGATFGSSLETIQATASHMAAWGGRTPHLLDEASAMLISRLVCDRLAFVLMNARTDERVPDVLLQLIKDGSGVRIGLDPLPDIVIDRLIDHAASDIPAARRRLRRLAAGNPLALRELLHGTQPGGLMELVESRLGDLRSETRFVVELVAGGELP